MATNTYILSITDFTTRADLSAYIRTDRLRQFFGIVQEQACLQVICKEMYDEIIDQLAQGGEQYLEPEYSVLLPYLKDFLVYKTMIRYVQTGGYFSTAGGIKKQIDQVSENLSGSERSELTQIYKNDAAYYQDQLIGFLHANEDDYPLWKDSRCNCYRKYATAPGNSVRFAGKKKEDDPNRIRWS